MKTILKLIMILITDLVFYKLFNQVDMELKFMAAWACGALNMGMVFFINALFEQDKEDI